MILQHEARRKGLPLDELTYQYTTTNFYDDIPDKKMDQADSALLEKKSEEQAERGGYYIYGLTIESGFWNKRMKFMEDMPPHPHGLARTFPALYLEIIEKNSSLLYLCPATASGKMIFPPNMFKELKKFALGEDGPGQFMDIVDQKNDRYFLTPLYVTSDRGGHSHALLSGLVHHVPIRCDKSCSTSFWIKRGTALICH